MKVHEKLIASMLGMPLGCSAFEESSHGTVFHFQRQVVADLQIERAFSRMNAAQTNLSTA